MIYSTYAGFSLSFLFNLKEKQFFLRREENIQRGKRTTLFRKWNGWYLEKWKIVGHGWKDGQAPKLILLATSTIGDKQPNRMKFDKHQQIAVITASIFCTIKSNNCKNSWRKGFFNNSEHHATSQVHCLVHSNLITIFSELR